MLITPMKSACSGGEGSPERNSILVLRSTPAELWVSEREPPLAIAFDSVRCNWLAEVIQ